MADDVSNNDLGQGDGNQPYPGMVALYVAGYIGRMDSPSWVPLKYGVEGYGGKNRGRLLTTRVLICAVDRAMALSPIFAVYR